MHNHPLHLVVLGQRKEGGDDAAGHIDRSVAEGLYPGSLFHAGPLLVTRAGKSLLHIYVRVYHEP